MPASNRIHVNPDWYGPYQIAQGYTVGDLVFLSGQCACGDKGQVIGAGDFKAQAELAFRNVETALRAAGGGLDNVVKITTYLTDMANMPAYNEIYARLFSDPWPAQTLIAIRSLALPELLIEIDVVANLAAKRQN